MLESAVALLETYGEEMTVREILLGAYGPDRKRSRSIGQAVAGVIGAIRKAKADEILPGRENASYVVTLDPAAIPWTLKNGDEVERESKVYRLRNPERRNAQGDGALIIVAMAEGPF